MIGTRRAASQRSFSAGLALHSCRNFASLAPSARAAPGSSFCCPLTTPPRRFKSSGSTEHAEQRTSSEHSDAKTQVNPTKDIPRQDQFSSAAQEDILQLPASQKATSQPLGRKQRRLSLTFTCTVADCGHRSSHEFSRHAYEKGIVLVQCPNCETRHLIGKLNARRGLFNVCADVLRTQLTT